MNANETSPAETNDKPWIAEPSGDGFYRVVNARSVVVAEKCVREEALLIAQAPELAEALSDLLDCYELNLDELDPETIRKIENAITVFRAAYGQAS